MKNDTTPTCLATRRDGEPCRANAGYSSAYCFQHDPARQTEAAAARSAGGKARSKPAPADPIDLSSIDSQMRAIETTVDRARRGDEPINVSRLVLYAISLARPLVELGEIEERLNALEQAHAAR